MNKSWIRWTILEAGTKTASKLLQKTVGMASTTPGHTFYGAALIGFVQTIVGVVLAKRREKKLCAGWANVIGSILFGIFAVISTVLGFLVFLYGGEIGVNTFIITLSIVPGAMIDDFFFENHLSKRQWGGIFIAILAGYAVLDAPSLEEILTLPLWVWLSVIMMLTAAVNQGVTQRIRQIDPYVKNFWGGLTTLILGTGGYFLVDSPQELLSYEQIGRLTALSLVIGIVVVLMWVYNVLAYQAGAYIAIKKLLLNGVYLSTTMVAGVLIFDEKMTVWKALGVLSYFGAFLLMDESTWNFVVGRRRLGRAV